VGRVIRDLYVSYTVAVHDNNIFKITYSTYIPDQDNMENSSTCNRETKFHTYTKQEVQ
jgi:hypothetical protein